MAEPVKTILVGIDGSERAEGALRWGCELADLTAASIRTLHARPHPIQPLLPALRASRLTTRPRPSERQQAMHEKIVAIAAPHNAEESVVMRPAPVALVEASRSADLLVLGRTGRGALENLLVGSTSTYCAHHSECPVALVGEALPTGRIYVAVDGSHHSISALRWALGVWPSSKICAAFAHDESVLDDLPIDDDFRLELQVRADTLLQDAISQAHNGSISQISSAIRTGDPRTTIVDALEPTDVLVVGMHGHSGLSRWMLGSLADYAMHHSDRTIVIWRPKL